MGRERRERTRKHLLQSVLHVCSVEDARPPVLIDDVVRHARVARGTFYQYFDSIDQAISELGSEMANAMTAEIADVRSTISDPLLRVATAFQLFLIRAMLDPSWGSFIAGLRLPREGGLFSSNIEYDINLGVEAGQFLVSDVGAAKDLLLGATVEGALRVIREKGSVAYVRTLATMVLNGFGVAPQQSAEAVEVAYNHLLLEAPDKLDWWRKPA